MASLLSRIRGGAEERASLEDFIDLTRRAMYEMTWTNTPTDDISGSFGHLASRGHGANGVVFACMAVRQFVFSAARFRWQRLRDGKPSDMFGSVDLRILETPWVGGTTQDLLSRLIQDADLAGNAFNVLDTPLTRLGGDGQAEIVRLRPDWVQIVTTPRMRPAGQLGERRLGYVYWEGGKSSGNDPVPLMPDEVSHFMPTPDPLHPFKGMSWLTPVIREVENDTLMSQHKRKFFENGATPNLIIKHAEGADREAIIAFDERLKANNAGVSNAYKNLNLYPGADVTVAGANMEQLDFKNVQGAGETRIAAAAGVPPVIVGLSEGLEAATYSNYSQARRRYGDGTVHPLWQNASGSLAPLLPSMGPDVRLWYDADNIPFLREDEKDAAEIQGVRASTIAALIAAGYTPESVIAAVEADDFRLLKHTGLFSVQLQKPGSDQPVAAGEVTT
ncbi:MAG TPA: phage portal protein [Aeromicrobium sp.]|nr:phage portal protein [Aeromicrobium sp.]HKY57533.1 phage portal protein [Aeromicrobium sp.]